VALTCWNDPRGTAIQAEDPQRLTLDEISSILVSLSFAGHETTTGLIGNTVRRLLEDPRRWAAVVDRPDLIPAAVHAGVREGDADKRGSDTAHRTGLVSDTADGRTGHPRPARRRPHPAARHARHRDIACRGGRHLTN
jgi:hypothetical protein